MLYSFLVRTKWLTQSFMWTKVFFTQKEVPFNSPKIDLRLLCFSKLIDFPTDRKKIIFWYRFFKEWYITKYNLKSFWNCNSEWYKKTNLSFNVSFMCFLHIRYNWFYLKQPSTFFYTFRFHFFQHKRTLF